jgi:PTS system glucose-specific IIA component
VSTAILAPLGGDVVALADVPDPVFAQELVGAGVAIKPQRGIGDITVTAPVAGKIVKLHPHAFVILGAGGVGVLVHVGIDTVRLKGEGFTLLAAEKSKVAAGDPVLRFNPDEVIAHGYSDICPVVVLDSKPGAVTPDPRTVKEGEELFAWG